MAVSNPSFETWLLLHHHDRPVAAGSRDGHTRLLRGYVPDYDPRRLDFREFRDGLADAVDRVWRADAAGMLGVLTRRLGDFGRAEDALQDALAEALRRWPVDGVPDSPAGWLVTTAWRRALDGPSTIAWHWAAR